MPDHLAIVEDDPDQRAMLERGLRLRGFSVAAYGDRVGARRAFGVRRDSGARHPRREPERRGSRRPGRLRALPRAARDPAGRAGPRHLPDPARGPPRSARGRHPRRRVRAEAAGPGPPGGARARAAGLEPAPLRSARRDGETLGVRRPARGPRRQPRHLEGSRSRAHLLRVRDPRGARRTTGSGRDLRRPVRGDRSTVTDNTIATHIQHIRDKLSRVDPDFPRTTAIRAVPSRGYAWETPPDAP